MDISSDKEVKSHMRKHGQDEEKETFREKQNLF